jgi:hypothetical protein
MKRDGTKPDAARHEVAAATMVISKRSGKRGGRTAARVWPWGCEREKSMG